MAKLRQTIFNFGISLIRQHPVTPFSDSGVINKIVYYIASEIIIKLLIRSSAINGFNILYGIKLESKGKIRRKVNIKVMLT